MRKQASCQLSLVQFEVREQQNWRNQPPSPAGEIVQIEDASQQQHRQVLLLLIRRNSKRPCVVTAREVNFEEKN
jgi:hypothetical protein